MSAKTIIHEDAGALGLAVATEIAGRFAASPDGPFLLGCPGGRSPKPVYAALSRLWSGIDLRRLVIVMMDDYVERLGNSFVHVPADAHYSCRRFARKDIQEVLNRDRLPATRLPDENVWFPDPANPDAYDDRIRNAGGIDYFLLASGATDGHVAFNPPGSAPDSRSRIVELAEKTRRDNLATFPDFRSLDAVPRHGVTVGIGTIAGLSRSGALVLWGHDKQLAFRRLGTGRGYDSSWPATVFRTIPGARLHADRMAAGR